MPEPIIPDANPVESSTAATTEPAQAPTGIAKAAAEAFKQSTSQVEQEPAVQELDTPAVTEETPPVETPATEEAAPTTEEATPAAEVLPFHDHPRWKEVTKERDNAKAKIAELEPKVKDWEPFIQEWAHHQNFIKEHSIPTDDVNLVMNFLAMRQQDPSKAREMLKPLWESLAQFDPGAIPADLQEEMKAGGLSEARAREIAQLRAKASGLTQRSQLTEQQQARRAQESMVSALTSWDTAQRRTNPDFKPKINGSKDGLYEMTAKGYAFLQQTRNPRNPQDVIKLVEQAYEEAKAFFAVPKVAVRPAVTSKNSSTSTIKQPKTIREVVAAEAGKNGLRF